MTRLRMPWPNRITLARILLIAPFVIAVLHMNDPRYAPWSRYTGLVIFLIMAISDALDGFLARRTNRITRLGTFLDPLADKLLIITTCLLLAAPATAVPKAKLPDAVVVIIISKDLLTVLGFVVIYFITSQIHIVPLTVGKVTTTLQLSMVVAILISPEMTELIGIFKYVVRGLWWSAAGMAIITAVVYIRAGNRYVAEYEQHQKNRSNQQE